MKRHLPFPLILFLFLTPFSLGQTPVGGGDIPVSADKRLVVKPFAMAPDIVHPISLDFDHKGRLLVVESHTHFRPANYQGPKGDRIRILEDTDGDGKADKFTTFYEGTTATMDLAVHPDGSVYVATRNEILRLRDEDGDGTAESSSRVVFLKTKGNYPHNGLSGLTFDFQGHLIFGMGENLGEPYELIGSDGKTLNGGGEGGNAFRCDPFGKHIHRIATGFWNPFGANSDIFGRFFVVDNDPDASPPCRLVELIEGGNYGFQFRYGRSGRHVFQSWNGELPGTLPYVAGTGESPCEVISYESDGLPKEYLGSLLVPAWADHRVERYIPKRQGAGLIADRKPFIQGGKEFRPSGLVVAPDGSLFISDWVSQSYELHGKGAIWHVQAVDAKTKSRPQNPTEAILSGDRFSREQAARALLKDETGRDILRKLIHSQDLRVQATALTALAQRNDEKIPWIELAKSIIDLGLREIALRAATVQGLDVTAFVQADQPPSLRAIALAELKDAAALPRCLELFESTDSYLKHAAIMRLSKTPGLLETVDLRTIADPKKRVGILLASLESDSSKKQDLVRQCLADPDHEVRFLAIKAIADYAWPEFREDVNQALKNTDLDHRSLIGLATALARIDRKPVNDEVLTNSFLERLKDPKTSTGLKTLSLRGIPAQSGKLTTGLLVSLLKESDSGLRIEALRALKERGDKSASAAIKQVIEDREQPVLVRAQAINCLASLGAEKPDYWLTLGRSGDKTIRDQSLRALAKEPLSEQVKTNLQTLAREYSDSAPLVDRLLGKPIPQRPAKTNLDDWVARFSGKGDPETGRRIFEHPKLANCSKCHAVDGRGAGIGPDLSLIGKTDRRWILESLTLPGNSVAPHYQAWTIETQDGRLRTGMLTGTHLDESVFVDPEGNKFKVQATDLVSMTPRKDSLMPDGLLDNLTDQEIRDLLAFLLSKK